MYLLKLFRRNNRNCSWCNRKGFKMKKTIISCLAMLLCLTMLCSTVCYANDNVISPRLTDVMQITSSFEVNSQGVAYIFASYTSYPDVVSYVQINIKLEKRVMLLFWKDVDSWSYQSSSVNYATDVELDVGSGTYRTSFEYIVHHHDGTTNTYTEELTDSK